MSTVRCIVNADVESPAVVSLIGGVNPDLLVQYTPQKRKREDEKLQFKRFVQHSMETISANSSIVSFVKAEDFGNTTNNLGSKFAIGVLDKKKNLTIYPIREISPLKLEINELKNSVQDHNKEIENLSYIRKHELLASTFGSKTNRSYTANVVANSVRMDLADVDAQQSFTQTNEIDESINEEHYSSLPDLPPYDYLTEDPKKIYKLENIFPKTIDSEIRAKISRFSFSTLEETLTQFVALFGEVREFTRWGLIQGFKDTNTDIRRKITISLAFYNQMVNFYLDCPKYFRRDEIPSIEKKAFLTKSVSSFLITKFLSTTQGKCSRTTSQNNLLVNHALILVLFLNEFSADRKVLKRVSKDFCLSLTDMGVHIHRVGCRTRRSRSGKDNDGTDETEKKLRHSISAGDTYRLVAPLLTAKRPKVDVNRLLSNRNKRKKNL